MRFVLTAAAFLLVVLPAKAAENGLMPPRPENADLGTLIRQELSAKPAVDPAEDWQDSVILPRHDVSPYVPIETLSPYVPERVDRIDVQTETAQKTDAQGKVSLSDVSTKTSLEAGPAVPPSRPWQMIDTGQAFRIVDPRGRSIAFVYYKHSAAESSGFLNPEEARAFAASIVNMKSSETMAQLSAN